MKLGTSDNNIFMHWVNFAPLRTEEEGCSLNLALTGGRGSSRANGTV